MPPSASRPLHPRATASTEYGFRRRDSWEKRRQLGEKARWRLEHVIGGDCGRCDSPSVVGAGLPHVEARQHGAMRVPIGDACAGRLDIAFDRTTPTLAAAPLVETGTCRGLTPGPELERGNGVGVGATNRGGRGESAERSENDQDPHHGWQGLVAWKKADSVLGFWRPHQISFAGSCDVVDTTARALATRLWVGNGQYHVTANLIALKAMHGEKCGMR